MNNNMIKTIKDDYYNYIKRTTEIKGYEVIYNIIDMFESSTDYGLSANFNYDIEIKNDNDLYINDVLIGVIDNIEYFKKVNSENMKIKFKNYIIKIQIAKTYNQCNINDVWISKIIKKYNDEILLSDNKDLDNINNNIW